MKYLVTYQLVVDADDAEEAEAEAKGLLTGNVEAAFVRPMPDSEHTRTDDDESSIVLTNAPREYDYGYTIDLGEEVQTDRFTLRTCVVPCSHVDYQVGRYQSGLYVSFVGATPDEAGRAAREF